MRNAFLTYLAVVVGQVAPSTHNQAFSAILFLYREVLQVDPGRIEGSSGVGGSRFSQNFDPRPNVSVACWFSVFEDESGFYLLPGVVKTYSPKAQTPIIREKQTRDHS